MGRREGFLEKGQTLEPVRCWWVGFQEFRRKGRAVGGLRLQADCRGGMRER